MLRNIAADASLSAPDPAPGRLGSRQDLPDYRPPVPLMAEAPLGGPDLKDIKGRETAKKKQTHKI